MPSVTKPLLVLLNAMYEHGTSLAEWERSQSGMADVALSTERSDVYEDRLSGLL